MRTIDKNDCNFNSTFLLNHEQLFNQAEPDLEVPTHLLSLFNQQIQALQKLIAELTHAKTYQKADFMPDEKTRAAIDSIKEFAPTVFANNQQYTWKTEQEIDATLHLLHLQVRALDPRIDTIFINQGYEDPSPLPLI